MPAYRIGTDASLWTFSTQTAVFRGNRITIPSDAGVRILQLMVNAGGAAHWLDIQRVAYDGAVPVDMKAPKTSIEERIRRLRTWLKAGLQLPDEFPVVTEAAGVYTLCMPSYAGPAPIPLPEPPATTALMLATTAVAPEPPPSDPAPVRPAPLNLSPPPPAIVAKEWKFTRGRILFHGEPIACSSPMRFRFLKALVEAFPDPVSWEDILRATFGKDVDRYPFTPRRATVAACDMRAWLRRTFRLSDDVDPLPCAVKGEGGAWSISIPV